MRAVGDTEIEVHDQTSDGVDVDRWCAVAGATLADEGVRSGRLDVLFVEREAMAELNREHMGHDGPTDVLAFPLDGPEVMGQVAGPVPPHLGDVVVCPAVAAHQAADHTGSFDAEMTLLVVHGVLHVLGHDHALEPERRRMQDRERVHLARHGFPHPEPEHR